jgi:hypothetical protein
LKKTVTEILKEIEQKRDEDKEYLEYLEREKREAHTHFGDDYLENPNKKGEV